MKALLIIAIMLISDLIIFGLIIPFIIKKAYQWYIKNTVRETVNVNPIVALIGGTK